MVLQYSILYGSTSIWPPPRSLLLSLPPTRTELTGICISSSVREHNHSCRTTCRVNVLFVSYNTRLLGGIQPENAKKVVIFTHVQRNCWYRLRVVESKKIHSHDLLYTTLLRYCFASILCYFILSRTTVI